MLIINHMPFWASIQTWQDGVKCKTITSMGLLYLFLVSGNACMFTSHILPLKLHDISIFTPFLLELHNANRIIFQTRKSHPQYF